MVSSIRFYKRFSFLLALFALMLCHSCTREIEFEYDETLAGSVAFMMERQCDCWIDGVKVNSGKDAFINVSINNTSDLLLEFSFVIDTSDDNLYCFPYNSEFWRVHIDPIPVSGVKGDVNFDYDTYVYYGPGPEHHLVYGFYGNVKGWLKNENYLANHPKTRGNRVTGEFSGEVTFTWKDADNASHSLVLQNFIGL